MKKANKALKRLAKIEALISDVSERYSSGASHIREALQDAMAAFARVKAAVSSQASSGTAKHPPGKPKKPDATTSPATPKPEGRRKRSFSAAQREQQAERMKAYWAAKKKTAAKPQPTAAARKAKKTASGA
jgi:hypothetical protein